VDGGAVERHRVRRVVRRGVDERRAVLGALPAAGVLKRSPDGVDLVPREAGRTRVGAGEAEDVVAAAAERRRDAEADVARGAGDEDSHAGIILLPA